MIGQRESVGAVPQSRPNAGYLTHVYAIACDGVAFVAEPGDDLFLPAPGIGLLPGAMVTEIACRPLTATLTEAAQTTADGTTYVVECSVPILSDAPETVRWVKRNIRKRFVLLTRDTLGNCFVVGTPDNGLRLGWGRQITARHSQNVVLRGVFLTPMPRVASIDLDALFP